MSVENITPTSLRVFDVIKAFIDEHGYPPTVRDVCQKVGWVSPSTAHQYMKVLEEHGYIKTEPYISRSVRILKEPER